MPEYYDVNSIYGRFRVHESRCLIFRNGILPEQTFQTNYRFWGIPEYVRIRRELRDAATSHGSGVELLVRSVQAIYKMKGLSEKLFNEGERGKLDILNRLLLLDMERGIRNSIATDADGEDYDFKTIPFSGVKDVIDTTCTR
jgi:hypothetical protein